MVLERKCIIICLSRYHLAEYAYHKCQDVEKGIWLQKTPVCEGRLEKTLTVAVGGQTSASEKLTTTISNPCVSHCVSKMGKSFSVESALANNAVK